MTRAWIEWSQNQLLLKRFSERNLVIIILLASQNTVEFGFRRHILFTTGMLQMNFIQKLIHARSYINCSNTI